jgi:hypothetical protein
MRAEEIEHRAQHRRIAKPGAQSIGRQAGQRKQPIGPRLIGQQPAERGERQRGGVARGGWGIS